MKFLHLLDIFSFLNSSTEFLNVSFFSSVLIAFQSGFVLMFNMRAITGSSASLTFAGGLEKFLSSSILPLVTPFTAF